MLCVVNMVNLNGYLSGISEILIMNNYSFFIRTILPLQCYETKEKMHLMYFPR